MSETIHTKPSSHREWLEARQKGIGASEAASVLGLSPYKTNVELWEEKTGRKQAKDISDKPYVRFGKQAEEHLREVFKLEFPEYAVSYDEFEMVANNRALPFAFATLDGTLTDTRTGKQGVLEIKTTEIFRQGQWEQWTDQVPEHYYVQIVHQLIATGYEFAVLKARIRYRKQGELNIAVKHYFFERTELEEDIAYLSSKELEFWNCVQEDRRPALILKEI